MNDPERDKCQFPKCKSSKSDMVYLGKGVCDDHWLKMADWDLEKINKKLKIVIKTEKKKK